MLKIPHANFSKKVKNFGPVTLDEFESMGLTTPEQRRLAHAMVNLARESYKAV